MFNPFEPGNEVPEEEEEDQSEYKQGGYHPVHIGERYLNRYTIIQKLGWGQFSTVWLAKDNATNTHVALKIQKSSFHYTEAAMDEIQILTKVAKSLEDPRWLSALEDYEASSRSNFVVQLLSHFVHKGPHGKHVCMVFEVLGVNLLEIIKLFDFKGIPIPLIRTIARQMLIGLDYLHRICGVIHTDIKPENILLQLTQPQLSELIHQGSLTTKFPFDDAGEHINEEPSLVLGRYSVNGISKVVKRRRYSRRPPADELPEETQARSKSVHSGDSQEENEHKSRRRKSWNFDRNPEDFIKPKLRENLTVKIADLGNACWGKKTFSSVIQTRQYRAPEVILGMKYSFNADIWSFGCMIVELITGEFLFDPTSGEDYGKNSDHLAQMWEVLGNFPIEWARTGKKFNKYFTRRNRLRNIPELRIWSLRDILIQKYRIIPSEADGIVSFVSGMLEFQPELRLSAQQCLQHPWLYEPPNYDYYLSEEEHAKFVSDEEKREKTGEAYLR
jgi:serine/threonine-protein kinase SRPK3